MRQSWKSVVQVSARELVPQRYYPLFLASVFVASLLTAYLLLPPINEMDWVRTVQQVRNLWRGVNPYCDPYCEFHDFDPDLPVDDTYVSVKVYSPWVMFYLGVLAYASTRVILALSAALWILIILDSGRPLTLILILHPAFWMLLASANSDFVTNGAGLWLILRGARGGRRGLALMLIAIKPQILPLLLLLEGGRTLWERDWQAIGVRWCWGACLSPCTLPGCWTRYLLCWASRTASHPKKKPAWANSSRIRFRSMERGDSGAPWRLRG